MKFDQTLIKIITANLASGKIPMLLGEPAIGKSSWVETLGESMRTKVFTLACNQLADKADLTGARLVPIEKDGTIIGYKQVFYPHHAIMDAVMYANENPRETPILFLDELNRTTPDITSALLSIPTQRSIGSTTLPANLRIIIAGNDKGNVTSLDEASITRFILYRVTPDINTFLQHNPNLNVFVKNVLSIHPELLFTKKNVNTSTADAQDDEEEDLLIEELIDQGELMSQITAPRTITAVSEILNQFTNQDLIEFLSQTKKENDREVSILQEVIEAHTGPTAFSLYLLEEIAKNIMVQNNQSNALNVTEPPVFKELIAKTTANEMEQLIDNMNESERSGCLLWALYQKQDNSTIIKLLSAHTKKLIPNDLTNLVTLNSSGLLDQENVKTLIDTRSVIGNIIASII